MIKGLATLENQVATVKLVKVEAGARQEKVEVGARREKMDVVTPRKTGQGTREMEVLPWHFDSLFPARQRWLIATQDLMQRKKRRQRVSHFLRPHLVVPRLASQTSLARKGLRYSGWQYLSRTCHVGENPAWC
jgi:hypothetical protein